MWSASINWRGVERSVWPMEATKTLLPLRTESTCKEEGANWTILKPCSLMLVAG